jgi:glutaredoxin 3
MAWRVRGRRQRIVIELYQAEWCPYSSRVRQRLTELGLSFTAHQVAPEPADREQLRRRTGSDEIPALVHDGRAIPGDADALIDYLDRTFEEPADAAEHRRQAKQHAAASS